MHGRATSTETAETASGHRARLRQRLLDAGAGGFHDYELFEYLLTLTIPRVDTKPLAKRLLHDFGGIGPLLGASAGTLRREGLTDPTIAALKIAEATALRLLGAFSACSALPVCSGSSSGTMTGMSMSMPAATPTAPPAYNEFAEGE